MTNDPEVLKIVAVLLVAIALYYLRGSLIKKNQPVPSSNVNPVNRQAKLTSFFIVTSFFLITFAVCFFIWRHRMNSNETYLYIGFWLVAFIVYALRFIKRFNER